MKAIPLKLIISFVLVMIISCDLPETIITDIIHPDGSVTRKIEMKNAVNSFEISDIQVPFDSTWTIRDSLEFTEDNDTVWVRRAEKFFKNIDEINMDYLTDSGANKDIIRKVDLRKKFRWFNTEYRFTETVDKMMDYGYPVKDFMNPEELSWFYSPENINNEKISGSDSLRYMALDDTVSKKTEKWLVRCLVSEWIGTFSKLAGEKPGSDISFDALKEREDEFVSIVETNDEKFDSLWTNGVLLEQFIGEARSMKFKTEADSALAIATDKLFFNFSEYTQRIIMPGKVIGTNGLIDSTGVMLWPVKSDYFLTEQYEMWAESKIPNIWAWIISGVFLLFVFTGIIFRGIKKS